MRLSAVVAGPVALLVIGVAVPAVAGVLRGSLRSVNSTPTSTTAGAVTAPKAAPHYGPPVLTLPNAPPANLLPNAMPALPNAVEGPVVDRTVATWVGSVDHADPWDSHRALLPHVERIALELDAIDPYDQTHSFTLSERHDVPSLDRDDPWARITAL
jgi:hypothetical protein